MTTLASGFADSDALAAVAFRRLGERLGRQWSRGDRLPPIRQLAEALEVSPGTAQRAVHKMVVSGFLVSRPRQGVYVSERFSDEQLRAVFAQPDDAGADRRWLAGKRVATFISIDSSHLRPSLDVIEAAVVDGGGQVERHRYPSDPQAFRDIDAPDTDVVVFLNPDTVRTIRARAGQHVLIVSTFITLPPITAAVFDVVAADEEHGGGLAGQFLREAGCQSACFAGVAANFKSPQPIYRPTSMRRLRAFEAGWGRPIEPANLVYTRSYSPLGGAHAAKVYAQLNPRPEGVFVASDDMAVGFVSGLSVLGLEVDRDYRLIGFDGQDSLQLMRPEGIPTVAAPAVEMGHQAVELLRRRIAQPGRPHRRVLVGCSLNKVAMSAMKDPVL